MPFFLPNTKEEALAMTDEALALVGKISKFLTEECDAANTDVRIVVSALIGVAAASSINTYSGEVALPAMQQYMVPEFSDLARMTISAQLRMHEQMEKTPH